MRTIQIRSWSHVPVNFTGIAQLRDKTKHWYLDGNLHRQGGPAVEAVNGDKEWFLHGKRHRVDDPAISCSNGRECWYLHGKRHREDGHAVINSKTNKYWYLHGKKTNQKVVELLYMLKHKKELEP